MTALAAVPVLAFLGVVAWAMFSGTRPPKQDEYGRDVEDE